MIISVSISSSSFEVLTIKDSNENICPATYSKRSSTDWWTFEINAGSPLRYRLPVANEGSPGTRSVASFRTLLEYLRLSTSSRSSSKSSMGDCSSTDIESRGSSVERVGKIGRGVATGTGGGALLGGEPDDSGFVAKKNSVVEPALFFKNKSNNKKNGKG
nr:hypothetical protein Iba_chr12cCG4910 [Ipomoea batatas]GMD71921.1 hypothetical protein Iba_chr12fCG3560 [Ipomoea batatas]